MNFKTTKFDPRKEKGVAAVNGFGVKPQNDKYFPMVNGKVLVPTDSGKILEIPNRENLLIYQCQRFSGDFSETPEQLKDNWIPGNPINQSFSVQSIFKETFSKEAKAKRQLQVLVLLTVEAYIKKVGEKSGFFRVYPFKDNSEYYFVYKAEFKGDSLKEQGEGLEDFEENIRF